MVKRKIDSCKTIIIKGTKYFNVNTKLFLTESEKYILKDDCLPNEVSKAVYRYKKSYCENIISIGFGYEIDKSDTENCKFLRSYVVLETYLRLNEYRRRLIVVNNQQRHMSKIKNVLTNMLNKKQNG